MSRSLIAAALWPLYALAQVSAPPVVTEVISMDGSGLCPGGLAVLFANNLPSKPGAIPPGLTVLVGGKAAAIWNATPALLQLQLPVDLIPGKFSVVVQYQGLSSAPFSVQINAFDPGISTFFGKIAFYGRTLGSAIAPGETIGITASGLGPTNPSVATGALPAKLAPTLTAPTLTVGGESAKVSFSGLDTVAIGQYVVLFTVPGDLPSGNYPLTLSVGGFTSPTVSLSVQLNGLSVSQSGFTFQSVTGGGPPAPGVFRLLNGTANSLAVTLTPSTVAGGSWLTVSPANVAVPAGTVGDFITVGVVPGSLSPGTYYGQIRVDAPKANNSPQFVGVVLNVSPATVNPGPVVQPTGLVFTGLANGAASAAASVQVATLTNRVSSFSVTGAAQPSNWFTFSPSSGTVAPSQPASVSVKPFAGLAAGVYRGTLTLQFPLDNATRAIDLLLVVTPAFNPTASVVDRLTSRAGSVCTPSKLLPVFSLLGSNFSTSVAWPANLDIQVIDDCASPMKSGSVTASFSNGDSSLSLASTQDGHWSATWAPVNPLSSSLVISADAEQPDLKLKGSAQISGAAQANPDVPIVAANGVVSSGSYSSTATPSPGELVSIFGTKLADGVGQATSLPLSTGLQNATFYLAGEPLPLVFTNSSQVNAQIPYDLPTGTTLQLVAQHGTKLSVPQPVSIAVAQPSIFSVDSSGKGQGHIYVIPGAGQQVLANASSPATAGDVLVIYSTGLGPVIPAVPAGSAVPLDQLRNTVNPVTLTIGGVNAPVLFAGLTPGFTGLYQVNTTVPNGIIAANQVPVILSVASQTSPPVTMAVK